MNVFKQFCDFVFVNHGEEAAKANSETIGLSYSIVLKFLAACGIFYGASEVMLAINILWLHLSGIVLLILVSTLSLIFLCFFMLYIGPWSIGQFVVWLGVVMMLLAQLFIMLRYVGGAALEKMTLWTIPYTVIATIGYLYYMPAYHKWSQKALGTWIIVTQLACFILFATHKYYLNYVVDPFEPAIPYAYNSIHYLQTRAWTAKVVTMGNGITMLLTSIYLYVVCKRHKS